MTSGRCRRYADVRPTDALAGPTTREYTNGEEGKRGNLGDAF